LSEIGAVVVRGPGPLAERADLLAGAAPADTGLARDLAAAAARDPRSTWCITVTGPDSRPVAHGCGRPPPRTSPRHHPPPGDDRSPPGTGTLRLNPAALTGTGTGKDLEFALESLAGPCDHAHQAGHDPGVKLRRTCMQA
jgi:hypothetical protein